ncbi:membrane-spanning 4-domains subfamily A member 15-like isoform 1-T1 [Discoglossus pictus]
MCLACPFMRYSLVMKDAVCSFQFNKLTPPLPIKICWPVFSWHHSLISLQERESEKKQNKREGRRNNNTGLQTTVLILVAVIELSFGVMLLAAEGDQPSLTVRSGVYIWGGLAVLVAGCVTVALETKESINMVKACVGCNLANLLLGGLSIILFAVQLHKETQACWVSIDRELTSSCYSIYNMTARQDYFYYYGESNYVAPLRVAVNSLAILYASLGIIITTCVLLFIWKAVKATKYSLLN